MVSPLDCYQWRCGEPWLWSPDGPLSPQFDGAFAQRYRQLAQRPDRSSPPVIMLAERSPELFLASFLAACAAQCPLFLGNPHWAAGEWDVALSIAQPDLIWRHGRTTSPPKSATARQRIAPDPGWIMVPTGGSSGQLKFAVHTWETLSASVTGFCQHFNLDQINACCTLPVYHVSGLMQFMRCLLSGGQMMIQPWRSLQAAVPFSPDPCFLSLVPAQLQQLLASPAAVAALKRFYAVLLGGAPAWPTLLDQGRSLQIPLAPTYGMTETAAQVATLKPADFLAGQGGCGFPLPHVQIDIVNAQGQLTHGPGHIKITGRSLYLGYYPEAHRPPAVMSDDMGCLDSRGLRILGRHSDKIISGGENIFPAEVEAAIRTAGLVADVAVVGVDDDHWGETPVALYVAGPAETTDSRALSLALTPHLSRYKHPSRWICLPQLPRNAQGKLDRTALRAIAYGISGPGGASSPRDPSSEPPEPPEPASGSGSAQR